MSADQHSEDWPVIALDGLSGSGKSTLARRLAEELSWAYLDSGAWYRALAWACLERDADPADPEMVLDTLSQIEIHGHADGKVVVDGRPLGIEIRTPAIDRAVADVADHPRVRSALTERMRGLRTHSATRGVVADGRDAGTVIFPDAGLKVFVEASAEARASRRYEQLEAAGLAVNYEQVLAGLHERDTRDAARGKSAPHPAPESTLLDNTKLTVEEALQRLLDLARPILTGTGTAPGKRPTGSQENLPHSSP